MSFLTNIFKKKNDIDLFDKTDLVISSLYKNIHDYKEVCLFLKTYDYDKRILNSTLPEQTFQELQVKKWFIDNDGYIDKDEVRKSYNVLKESLVLFKDLVDIFKADGRNVYNKRFLEQLIMNISNIVKIIEKQ